MIIYNICLNLSYYGRFVKKMAHKKMNPVPKVRDPFLRRKTMHVNLTEERDS